MKLRDEPRVLSLILCEKIIERPDDWYGFTLKGVHNGEFYCTAFPFRTRKIHLLLEIENPRPGDRYGTVIIGTDDKRDMEESIKPEIAPGQKLWCCTMSFVIHFREPGRYILVAVINGKAAFHRVLYAIPEVPHVPRSAHHPK